jgi:hypothetical protein
MDTGGQLKVSLVLQIQIAATLFWLEVVVDVMLLLLWLLLVVVRVRGYGIAAALLGFRSVVFGQLTLAQSMPAMILGMDTTAY